MSCLSYFYQKGFKQTERRFSSFKLDRGYLRIPHDTLTVSSSYRSDILTYVRVELFESNIRCHVYFITDFSLINPEIAVLSLLPQNIANPIYPRKKAHIFDFDL